MQHRFKSEKDVTAAYKRLSSAEGGEPLGATDQQRLMTLAKLIQSDGRIKTVVALQALYEKPDATAEANFRKLASRLNVPQEDTPILQLNLSDKAPLEQRYCWFEGDTSGPDDARQLLAEQTRRETVRVVQQTAAQDAAPLEAEPKPVPVRIFVSYAHVDNVGTEKERLVDRLMNELMPVLRGFGQLHGYKVQVWQDHKIICDGPGWDEQIQQAMRNSELGLLMVSHQFLDRNYIVQNELPHFLPERSDAVGIGDRWMIGVQLKGLHWGAVGKLKEHQLFAHKIGNLPQSYQDCRRKDKFARALAETIHDSICRRLPLLREVRQQRGSPKNPAETEEPCTRLKRSDPLTHFTSYDERLHDHKADADAAPTLIQAQDDTASPDRTNAKPVAQLLDNWLDDPNGAPYFALLGETGTGKTTQCQLLAIRRNSAWKTAPSKPQCVYLDLRRIGTDIHDYRSDLRRLLDQLLRQGWTGDGEPPTADDVLRVVREEGALLIWDGLDEVGVHLTKSDQLNRLMTTLWSVLPPPEKRDDGRYRIPGVRPGRILLTCRSQFFREARLQNQVLLGLGREGLSEQCFDGATLLSLTEEQDRHYFEVSLPDQDIDAVMAMIASVHNLTELSQRAMTLTLIREQIPRLQQAQLRGERINGVTLYRNFVDSWLSRDTGKHTLEPRHKLTLMQVLAAQLWRRNTRSWDVDELDDWFAQALEKDRQLARHYRKKELETLKADLRTATFVQRDGERHYRFAHTSLLEYFLAGHLLMALQQNRRELWELASPSAEIWDFFAQHLQLFENAELQPLMIRLTSWGQGDVRVVNENLWSYAVRALSRGWPIPSLRGLNLPNLRADGIRLHAGVSQPLDLRDAAMQGASLHGAWLRYIDWRGADLSGVNFTQTNLERCDLSGANLAEAWLQHSRWYELATDGARFDQVDTSYRLWVSSAQQAPWSFAPTNLESHPGRSLSVRLDGHERAVMACVLSADGRSLYSASWDGTLKAWDVASGRCLVTFTGHEGPIRTCALSVGGRRLYSGADDGTLKAWDVTNGYCLMTFKGHKRAVMACALSADGHRLYSASDDGTLKVWDVASGRHLATFSGRTGLVVACALSADGRRLYSASKDRTLKAWDVASGRCLAMFSGHGGAVMACALSADGCRLYSASQDRTLKAWDVASGRCLATFSGHASAVMSCAVSADGRRLYSGGWDGTLKAWDVASEQCLATFRGHEGPVRACALSANGRRLYSSSQDRTLKAWDVASVRCIATFKGGATPVIACVLSADGRRLYSASDDGALKAWDVASGSCLTTFSGHASVVTSCALSADGRRLYSASQDRTLKAWEVASGRCVATFKGHEGPIWACVLSADGCRLYSASQDQALKTWDVATGHCLATFRGRGGLVMAYALSADGCRLYSALSNGVLKAWDVTSGRCLATFRGHEYAATACVLSADGCRLYSASQDRTMKVWDVASRRCLATFTGHGGGVRACVLSADGRQLYSASEDGTLKAWDIVSGRCMATFTGHKGGVTSCSLSADGSRLYSTSLDGSLRRWDTATAQESQAWWFARNDGWAVTRGNAIVIAQGEVWRWLRWTVPNPETGEIEELPVETFGPLSMQGD